MLAGAYSVCVRYYNKADQSWTRFSPITPVIYIYDDYASNGPGKPTVYNLEIQVTHNSNRYEKFQIAIIYDDGVAKQVKLLDKRPVQYPLMETITVSDTNMGLPASLEDILVETANFTRVETYSSIFNELEIGNLRIESEQAYIDAARLVAKNVRLIFSYINYNATCGKELNQLRIQHFQSDEVYAFYLNCYNRKGNLVATVPFTSSNVSGGLIVHQVRSDITLYRIPLSVGDIRRNIITVALPANVKTLLGDIDITGFTIGCAVRSITNSRIITQGYMMPNNKYTGVNEKGVMKTPMHRMLNANENEDIAGFTNGDWKNMDNDTPTGFWKSRSMYRAMRFNADSEWGRNYVTGIAHMDTKFAFVKNANGNAALEYRLYAFELLFNRYNLGRANVQLLERYEGRIEWTYQWLFLTQGQVTKLLDPFMDGYGDFKERFAFLASHFGENCQDTCSYIYKESMTNSSPWPEMLACKGNGGDTGCGCGTGTEDCIWPFELPSTYLGTWWFNDNRTFEIDRAAKAYESFRRKLFEYCRGERMNGIYTVSNIDYIINDNRGVENIGGESYNRLTIQFNGQIAARRVTTWFRFLSWVDVGGASDFGKIQYQATVNVPTGEALNLALASYSGFVKVNLLNTATEYYSNVNTAEIQIVSHFIVANNSKSAILVGDTFLANLYIRATHYGSDGTMWYVKPNEASTGAGRYEAMRYSDFQNAVDGKAMNNDFDIWKDGAVTNPYIWVISIPVESKYNLHARYANIAYYTHQYKGNGQYSALFDSSQYPISKDNFINTEDGFGYDKVYNSVNNTYRIGVSIDIEEQKTWLFNRIARSHKQNSEVTYNAWRYFDVANYYDMPLKFGEIVRLHGVAKELYIQQRKSLHIATIKDTLTADGEGTAIGSADLFDRLPQEIIQSPYGYIGCLDHFATDIFEGGIIVIDAQQSKIFLVNGTQAEEITTNKIEHWVKDRFAKGNPYEEQGSIFIYDKTHRRLIFTSKIGQDEQWTLSYDYTFKSWISFHSYWPMLSWYNRLGTFMINNQGGIGNETYKMVHYNRGIYFQSWEPTPVPAKSILQTIYNEAWVTNKFIEFLTWDTSIRVPIDNSVLNIYNYTWNKLLLHNDTQCTGWMDVQPYNEDRKWIHNKNGIYKESTWFWNNIRDLVKDDSQPFIKGYCDVILENIDSNRSFFRKSLLISQYLYVTMVYNNGFYNPDTNSIDDAYAAGKIQAEFIINNIDVNIQLDNRIVENDKQIK